MLYIPKLVSYYKLPTLVSIWYTNIGKSVSNIGLIYNNPTLVNTIPILGNQFPILALSMQSNIGIISKPNIEKLVSNIGIYYTIQY